MLREFMAAVRTLPQQADRDKFYEMVDKVMLFERDEAVAALDKVFDQANASTKKLADAQVQS